MVFGFVGYQFYFVAQVILFKGCNSWPQSGSRSSLCMFGWSKTPLGSCFPLSLSQISVIFFLLCNTEKSKNEKLLLIKLHASKLLRERQICNREAICTQFIVSLHSFSESLTISIFQRDKSTKFNFERRLKIRNVIANKKACKATMSPFCLTQISGKKNSHIYPVHDGHQSCQSKGEETFLDSVVHMIVSRQICVGYTIIMRQQLQLW